MIVECLTVGPFQENTYIVGCEITNEAIVIDPGDEADRIIARIDALGLNVTRIFNTHGHADHLGAVQELRDRKGAKFYIHENELPFVEAYDLQCRYFGVKLGPAPKKADGTIAEGEIIKVGELEAVAVLTPGHSPGGMCFNFGGRIFVGDTLFAGSIGRSDFEGGDHRLLISSIKTKLLTLPANTVASCGHGPDTTIGVEKTSNPFLT